MPYKDPERRRAYQREWARLKRAGMSNPRLSQNLIPAPVRVETAREVLDLLAEQVAAVRADPEATTLEKARTIGYLAGVMLRGIEAADLAARIERLEQVLEAEKAAAG